MSNQRQSQCNAGGSSIAPRESRNQTCKASGGPGGFWRRVVEVSGKRLRLEAENEADQRPIRRGGEEERAGRVASPSQARLSQKGPAGSGGGRNMHKV